MTTLSAQHNATVRVLPEQSNVTMTSLPEQVIVTVTRLPDILNATMTRLSELDNVSLISPTATLGNCSTTTPRVNASTDNSTISNTTTTCPVDPLMVSGTDLSIVPLIIQCTVGVCVLLANVSILIVLRKCRPAGRTLHYLLQNLAAADLGMSVATFWKVGLVIRYGLTVEDVPLRCAPVVILYIVSGGVSISSLLLIAFEQWYSAAQNASLESRQRWRRCCWWAVPCSWVVWISMGLLCIPATKAPGSYLGISASCLLSGTFIHNAYWQLIIVSLIMLCVVTVIFQWLSLQAARANTQNLMEALKQRHEAFILSCKVPVAINQIGRVKKKSVFKTNHSEVRGHATVDLTSTRTTSLESSYHMSMSGNINRITPLDPIVFPVKGDYYEMKLANTRLQLTKTISIVMAVFVGCWFIYLPICSIMSACGTACHTIHSYIGYVGIVPVANSFMNAIIYTFRIKQYRAAFHDLLCGVSTRSSSASVPIVSDNVTTIRELALPPIK